MSGCIIIRAILLAAVATFATCKWNFGTKAADTNSGRVTTDVLGDFGRVLGVHVSDELMGTPEAIRIFIAHSAVGLDELTLVLYLAS